MSAHVSGERISPGRVSLLWVGKNPGDLRWMIRADGRHAGGITVYPREGGVFSCGIAVIRTMRRRGVARRALLLLFREMADRGFTKCAAYIAPDNGASLALHRSIGFTETGRDDGCVRMERPLLLP